MDNVSKNRERKVNASSFFKSVSSCASFSLPFAACQIHKIKFSFFDFLLASLRIDFALFDNNGENAVTARAPCVHVGLSNCFAVTPFVQQLEAIFVTFDLDLAESVDVDDSLSVLLELEFLLVPFEKISDLLVVQLEH